MTDEILQPIEPDIAMLNGWTGALTEIEQRIGPRFARSEARDRALAYVRGLLSPAERKNGWQLAEMLGNPTPYGIQHLLGRANWDADAVRDDLYEYVFDHLDDPEAILVVDETGFLKKGRHSVGVARQYSGTAGRVENCQIGVFLAYAGKNGHTLIDRDLYLPQAWTNDPERCYQAGVPVDHAFATKPALARQMLERAFAAGVRAAWVTGDSVYGDDHRLRLWLEDQGHAYVLGLSSKAYVWIGMRQHRISDLLAQVRVTDEGWTHLSAGDGAKGPRWYDWYLIPLSVPLQEGWRRWVLIRRSLDDPTDLRAFIVFAPAETELQTMVRVAGSRWAMEVVLKAAKGEVGLDQYEVRMWTGWYRHITLALWAHALLAVVRVASLETDLFQKGALHRKRSSSLAAFKARRGLSCD